MRARGRGSRRVGRAWPVWAALLAAAGLTACAPPAPPPPSGVDASDAQRVVALLDYVGSDYAVAVSEGQVISAPEYAEQLAFVADAQRLAAAAAASEGIAGRDDVAVLTRSLGALDAAVKGLAAPDEVARLAQAARDEAVTAFDLRTRPSAPPSLERAEMLYRETCATCHGPAGEADTARARELDPAPVSFRDAERRDALSPYRVYNTLTFGIPGTAMASYAEALTPADRWALAFYVLRLGHQGAPAREGPSFPLGQLAARSDAELRRALGGAGAREPGPALTWLRAEAPFRARAGSVDATRDRLRDALATARAGRPADADRLVLDAYLNDFEPVEPGLRARDAAGTAEVEKQFMALRGALAEGDLPAARQLHEDLDRRLAAMAGGGARLVPFLAAFFIYLREGVECALLVGALLAAVRRMGRPEAARWVHAGWMAALPAGVLTWFAAERLLHATTRDRELMEAVVGLVAAAVLFSVSFWMISRVEARHWMAYLQRQVEETVTTRRLVVLALVSFLAVYREAAETVLFTQAVLLDARSQESHVWAGAAAGLAVVVAVAALLARAVHRLPLGWFFGVSGALLCVLAVSFTGAGLNALVAAGYLRPRPVSFPDLPWLGVYPDLNALLVQLAIVLAVAAAGLSSLRRRDPAP